MKTGKLVFIGLCVLMLVYACGGGSGGNSKNSRNNEDSGTSYEPDEKTTGDVTFKIDFNELLEQEAIDASAKVSDANITAVTVTLTRTDYAQVVKDLTVSNNIATGRVSDLDAGLWTVSTVVYDDTTLIYRGHSEVNVIAGTTVVSVLLLDPVIPEPTTGNVEFTVSLNPMPGYRAIEQTVTEILFDSTGSDFYVLDASAKVIGVYSVNKLRRKKNIALQSAPMAVALNSSGTGIYLGYSSGQIYELDVDSEAETLITDVLMEVQGITTLNNQFILVRGPGSWRDASIKIVDVSTKQVVSTKTSHYSFRQMTFNPTVGTVYSERVGVSPSDIHAIRLDMSTGTIREIKDSVYHGDYYYGAPLRIINSGARVVSSSGNMFTSSELSGEDLKYSGNIGYAYKDLCSDDTNKKLYLLNKNGIKKLLVLNQSNYFLESAIDLKGEPQSIFHTSDSILVVSTLDSRYYIRAFLKTDLGI